MKTVIYTVVLLASFGIIGGLAYYMKQSAVVPDTTAARVEERFKFIKELKGLNGTELTSYDVIDKTKGVYRMPVEQAMELALKEWGKNPAEGRAALLKRLDKANFEPPKAPEKPSAYE